MDALERLIMRFASSAKAVAICAPKYFRISISECGCERAAGGRAGKGGEEDENIQQRLGLFGVRHCPGPAGVGKKGTWGSWEVGGRG